MIILHRYSHSNACIEIKSQSYCFCINSLDINITAIMLVKTKQIQFEMIELEYPCVVNVSEWLKFATIVLYMVRRSPSESIKNHRFILRVT